jgi:hypothetical protein
MMLTGFRAAEKVRSILKFSSGIHVSAPHVSRPQRDRRRAKLHKKRKTALLSRRSYARGELMELALAYSAGELDPLFTPRI